LGQNYKSSCAGGYVDFAGDLIRRNGAPTEADFPYLGASFGDSASTPTTANICKATPTLIYAGDYTVTDYNIYRNITNEQMKTLLADGGPVGVLIYADSGFMSYSSGIYSGCPSFSSSYNNINHAVSVVGYDASGNYIVKNSWATTWGESGFGTVSASNDCAITAFVYQYASTAASGSSLTFTGQVDLGDTVYETALKAVTMIGLVTMALIM